ncbi:hypothetical protein LEP3755_30420 [Leptolyngbya sp. NIES-3755]|nr:hypothetical protein LEP3755_30420 [Leptolyngbya sp. NIES-3755]
MGLSPLPVAPKKADRKQFTGKNPSYIDQNGNYRIVNHSQYQDNQPTKADLKKWFFDGHQNGIGCLGSINRRWIDFDAKQVRDPKCGCAVSAGNKTKTPCEHQIAAIDLIFSDWCELFTQVLGTWVEKTQGFGYRVLVELTDPNEQDVFTNFALEDDSSNQMGEALGYGRFAVLAPTKGVFGLYESVSDGEPVKVAHLSDLGIVQKKSNTKSKVRNERQMTFDQAPSVPTDAIAVPLEKLVCAEVLHTYQEIYEETDRSGLLSKCIREVIGWQNVAESLKLPIEDSEAFIEQCYENIYGDNPDWKKIDRVTKTLGDRSDLEPAKCAHVSYTEAQNHFKNVFSQVNGLEPQLKETIEIPMNFQSMTPEDRNQWVNTNLEAAILHLSKEKTDQLIVNLSIQGFPIDKDQIVLRSHALVNKYRRNKQVDELASFKGSYLWSVISKDKTFCDYLSLIKRFGKNLRFNTLKKQVELDSKPFPIGIAKTQLNIEKNFQAKSGKAEFEEIFVIAAKRNSYSPIVEYLDRVSSEYGNSTNVLNGFTERYFGQTELIYNSMLTRSLVAAVARAYNPGCKVDTALILQGKQGARKSTFFKILAGGDQYFDDSLGNVGDKDEKLKLHRVWFVEWAELETVFRRKDVASTKAFLSSSTDFVRPPYGRDTEEMSRASVIVGTTNQEEFLSDSTGNRRFWVIPVLKDIDTDLLQKERNRIWAAAVALYKAGQQYWLTDLEEVAASGIAEQFQTSDPWTEPVLNYATDQDFITTKEILDRPLQIEVSKQDKASQMRVAEILKKAGWLKGTKRVDGRLTKCWCKPNLPTIEDHEPSAFQQTDKPEVTNDKHPRWATVGGYAVHKGSTIKIVKIEDFSDGCSLIDPTGCRYLAAECQPEQIPTGMEGRKPL